MFQQTDMMNTMLANCSGTYRRRQKKSFVELPRRAQRILDRDRSIVSAGGLRDTVPSQGGVNERLKMGRNGCKESECRKVRQCRMRDETP
jgi:hypothetical protein